MRKITPPKESWDVFQITIFIHQIEKILNKKNQNYNEFIFLYKYTKMPNDIINKILEYNY